MLLLLFSAKYPYDIGAEQNFLDIEIRHLADIFDRVILVPRNTEGKRLPLPKGVEVDESYASFLNKASKIFILKLVLQATCFYREIVSHPLILFSPSEMVRLAAFVGGAQLTYLWVNEWIRKNKVPANQMIIYSYWFDQASMGIGMVKKQHPDIRLISRAHGYDIYADYYYKLGFWPCRRIAMSFLERIFPDSQAGTNYLKKNFPEYAAICEPSLQGVSDPGFVNAPSQDHVFRVMSCSMIRTEKRVELLFAGFKRAAEMRPDQKFEWHHIGNGKTRGTLQEKANETLPVNAKAYLPGYTNKETLMRFYRDAPLDVFVNVSATEGTPVSIMEAISCGIPVIATVVGGNVEIVSERNGILLRPDPTPEEIAQALFKIWDNPEKTLRMRKESRKIWAESYNAEVNFRVFAQKLKAIREAE